MITTLALTLFTTQFAQTHTASVANDFERRQAIALEKLAEATARMADATERMLGVTKTASVTTTALEAHPESWSGTIGFGLIWLSGNAETLTLSGNGSAQLKLPEWILGVKAGGVYGQTVVAGGGDNHQVVALAAFL